MSLAGATTDLVSRNDTSKAVGDNLLVHACRNWSELEEAKSSWESILADNPLLSIFSTPEWLGPWWNSYADATELMSLTFSQADRIVGLAPLFRSAETVLGWKRMQQLRLVGAGSGDSDNLDFVISPGHESNCVAAFLNYLKEDSSWDVCYLETLAENSSLTGPLVSGLAERRWPCQVIKTPHWNLHLPSSWEQYVNSLAPDFRPLLTRYPKRLESRYRCRVVRSQTAADVDRYLPVLFDLHQRRWEEAGYPGAFASPARRKFYQAMASAFLRRGWLEFWALELNEVPVATQFCFRYKDTVYLLQEGFDTQYIKDRIGYALRSHVLRYCIETGVKCYDFLGGSDSYKQKFGAQEEAYLSIKFAKPRTLGALSLHQERVVGNLKTWLRTNLPASVVSALRSGRQSKPPHPEAERKGRGSAADS